MSATRRTLPLAGSALGGLGVLVCVAAAAGTWVLHARLHRATENVSATVDRVLVAVQDRVEISRERVESAKITSEEFEARLKTWAKTETLDRLAVKTDIDGKALRIVTSLERADDGLDFAESSLELVQQAVELADSGDAPRETERIDSLLEEVGSLREQLAQAAEAVEEVRRQVEGGDEASFRATLEKIVRLVARVVATVSSLDERLRRVSDRLAEVRTRAQDLNAGVLRWLRIGAVVLTVLAVWMAAGQVSLCVRFWRSGGGRPAQGSPGR